jgi:alcohol dehydrogenase class IV
MLLDLLLFTHRFIKALKKPLLKLVAIPRPVLIVGTGSTAKLCQLIGGSGARRTVIVTDAILVRLGLLEPVRRALEAEGVDVAVFDGIVPDPTEEVLERGLAALRAPRGDSVLGVGGGSSIDAAKVIAAMATTGKSPAQLVGVMKVSKAPLPLYAIPTTAGTGSEVTVAAVVTDSKKHEKSVVVDPKLVPVAAALDPVMMKGMPPPITAATGMDALTHAIEAYVSLWPQADTAMLCVSSVKLIFANLPRAYAHGEDLEARESMALASLYAGLAFTRASVGYVHAFSHKLGGMYGVPHGLGNAIVLPKVLDFSKDSPVAEARLAELAVAIGAGSASEPKSVLAQRFIDRVRELNGTVGIPEKVAVLRAEDIPVIARAACVEGARDYPVPKNMNLRQAEALLRDCLQ